jgi:hypothetical protein
MAQVVSRLVEVFLIASLLKTGAELIRKVI